MLFIIFTRYAYVEFDARGTHEVHPSDLQLAMTTLVGFRGRSARIVTLRGAESQLYTQMHRVFEFDPYLLSGLSTTVIVKANEPMMDSMVETNVPRCLGVW